MMNLIPKRNTLIVLIISLSIGFASCTSRNSASDTTWALTKLVNTGAPIENTTTETVEVKNCGIPIEKTTDCSAGTSNDLSVALNSGGNFGVGTQFTIGGNIGATLGIGQQSGESVKLDNPADGFIYTYTVNKKYQVVTGQAIASSSNGEEQTVDYIFHSSCSIDIVKKEQTSCSSNTPSPTTMSESTSTKTPNWAFTLERRFPPGFWSVGTHTYTLAFTCPNEAPDNITRDFTVSDNFPLLSEDVYLRWSALRAGDPWGKIVDGINPSQPTVASVAWDTITKSQADWRVSNCTGTISWDGGAPEALNGVPFQH